MVKQYSTSRKSLDIRREGNFTKPPDGISSRPGRDLSEQFQEISMPNQTNKPDAILICLAGDVAVHRFCTQEEGRAVLRKASASCENASMFDVTSGQGAELVFNSCPEIK